jgi:hypothetical protein
MQDKISVYSGIRPIPQQTAKWPRVIENIISGKYKSAIAHVRAIEDPEKYRLAKTKLPAVTFGGTFNGRRKADAVQDAIGFIVADLDHLEDVKRAFSDCDWQLKVRQTYDPIEADNAIAEMEQKIRRKIAPTGEMSWRELTIKANAYRSGLTIFKKAIENLRFNHEVKIYRKGQSKFIKKLS